jgi:hypothetical protein
MSEQKQQEARAGLMHNTFPLLTSMEQLKIESTLSER